MFGALVSQQDLLRFNLAFGILNQYFLSIKTNENYSSNSLLFSFMLH